MFHSTAPDIAILDQFTEKQGISRLIHKKVESSTAVPFPVYNDFFNGLWFTIFYVRLKENKNVLKVEVPYYVEDEDEIREMTEWIAGLTDAEGQRIGTEVPLHISRFFPRFHMTDRNATDVRWIYHLRDIAREKLRYVYTGNC